VRAPDHLIADPGNWSHQPNGSVMRFQGCQAMTSSNFQRMFPVWALSFLAALYLFRGMLEFPSIGWQPQTILTVVIGLGLLPALAALAAATSSWRRPIILGLCVLGLIVNAVLAIALWEGLTLIASVTLLIIVLYASVVWVEFPGRE
jgi:hypothetical protein